MRPDLKFEILDWADELHVVKVRIFGTDHDGRQVDVTENLRGLVTIREVHDLVAKMNNNHFRP